MEVTPTQFRRSVTKDMVDTKEAAPVSSKSNCNNKIMTTQQPSMMRTLVKLSEEQTKGLNFPLGCPVWYNFSQSSCFSGVVQTVHLDIVQKKLVYTVSRKNTQSKSANDKQSLVLDTVSEDDISYAFNCPVTLSLKSDDAAGDGDDSSNKKMAGEIMFAENVADEMLYVVKLIPSGDEEGGESHIVRFEDGVKASRLRYREIAAKAVPSKQQQHCDDVKKDAHTSSIGGEKVEAVSSSEEEHSLEERLIVQQRSNQVVNVGDRATKEQCSSSKKKKLQKKPQVPNKKKAEIKYKPRNNNHNNKKNSYYGPSMNPKANFPRRNSRDEFGRMPRKKKEGNKSRGGLKKTAGQDHQVQASLGGASSSQAFKQKVEKTAKALPIKWQPPAKEQQSCLHYENDGAI